MTRQSWFVGAALAALLTCPPAFGAGDKPEAKPAKAKKNRSLLRGEYSIMASVLEMDDAQKEKLVEALKANRASLEQWKAGPAGQKLAELVKAYGEARRAGEKAKLKEIAQEMTALKEAAEKLEQENKQRIMGVLTDEQKNRWAAFCVERQILRKFSKAELTEEQKKRIKDMCLASVKAPAPDEDDRKARAKATRKLAGQVEQEVLTADQRDSLKKPARREEKDPKNKGKEKPEKKPAKDSNP